ncbi:MAG: hypothetical protein ACRBN8_02150 [Nannocystales bacterium]
MANRNRLVSAWVLLAITLPPLACGEDGEGSGRGTESASEAGSGEAGPIESSPSTTSSDGDGTTDGSSSGEVDPTLESGVDTSTTMTTSTSTSEGSSGGACEEGAVSECYEGAEGTLGVGSCVAGLATCSNGEFGPCERWIGPSAEACGTRVDADCDGMSAPACAGDVAWQNLLAGQRAIFGQLLEHPDGSHLVVGTTGGYDFEPWPGLVEESSSDSGRVFMASLSESGAGVDTTFFGETVSTSDDISVMDVEITTGGDVVLVGRGEGPVDFGGGAGPDFPLLVLRISDGELAWVRQFPQGSISALSNGCYHRRSIAYSPSDDSVVFTGCYTAAVEEPPLGLPPSTERTDYVAKLDSSGNAVFAHATLTNGFNAAFDVACFQDGVTAYYGASAGDAEWILEDGPPVPDNDIFAFFAVDGSFASVTYSAGLETFPSTTRVQLAVAPDQTLWALRKDWGSNFWLEQRDENGAVLASSTESDWPTEMLSLAANDEGQLLLGFELAAPADFGAFTLTPTGNDSTAVVVADPSASPPSPSWGREVPEPVRVTGATDGDLLLSISSFDADEVDLGAGLPPDPSISNSSQDTLVARIHGE